MPGVLSLGCDPTGASHKPAAPSARYLDRPMSDESLIVPGGRCQIIAVRWPEQIKTLGKYIKIVRVYRESKTVLAHFDEPVTYRLNSRGRQIIERDPSCIQSFYSFDEIKPLPPKSNEY